MFVSAFTISSGSVTRTIIFDSAFLTSPEMYPDFTHMNPTAIIADSSVIFSKITSKPFNSPKPLDVS